MPFCITVSSIFSVILLEKCPRHKYTLIDTIQSCTEKFSLIMLCGGSNSIGFEL